MSWWQNLIIGSAALAIQTLALVIKSPEGQRRYYTTAVSIWQAAKQLQQTMLFLHPDDPNFR